MFTRLILRVIEYLAYLPLSWVRGMGVVLGWLLYLVVGSRRKVVYINLRLCFPHWTQKQVRRCAVQTFVHFAQSWLDRGWLWHAPAEVTRQRIRLTGALNELQGSEPVVLFAPHFFALDAGWTGLTQQISRRLNTIYTDQANKDSDAWILRGRARFGAPGLFGRVDGVKPIVAGLKRGEPLYLLPDMNFGPHESLWVTFYGATAATVPSLSRFARLARAKVVPVVSRITSEGYEVKVMEAWTDFPTSDLLADTALMNQRLQSYIDDMPDQYYWVHKRFKDQPDGKHPPY
ncbi:MAG: lipid A biosynthesis acyltransferase [Burkholderiales bacterium PBB4]|nr:MAG: lipid A biosynthesis acyltransferase [Burkholderiales bacterium PBB4]